MMILVKLALREIANHKKFSIIFIFNLALGLSCLLGVDTLKDSVQRTLEERSKGILTADISVGARRFLSSDEFEILNKTIPVEFDHTDTYESFTMVATASNSRLVELKAIEQNYPFYGTLILKNAGSITSSTSKDLFTCDCVWVYPELLIQLNLKIGDKIRIGQFDYTISDTIVEDSAGGGGGFSFAPPLYLSRTSLDKSKLIKTGSTGYFARLYKYSYELTEAEIDTLVKKLNSILTDPAVQVTTSKNASEQVSRILIYLGDYLGLAGLVAIFLTALGQIFLFRNYIVVKRKNMAIFKSLGLDNNNLIVLYGVQLIFLNLAALVPTTIAGYFFLPLFKKPVYDLLQMDISLKLNYGTIGLMLCFSAFGHFFICGPLLLQTLKVKARELFQPTEAIQKSTANYVRMALQYLPAIFAYYTLSIVMAKSFKNGTLFFTLFSVSLLALTFIAFLLIRWAEKIKLKNLLFRFAVRNIVRERWASIALFVTFGLAILLSQLIPILATAVRHEIIGSGERRHPSLFLFDIQEDQLNQLNSLLQSMSIETMQSSPMIRARLSTVNGVPFEKANRNDEALTREQENENRFRNRGFNLTYRQSLSESETLVAGSPFNAQAKTPEVSLEKRFADRLDLKLNDILTFDIQGVTIEGHVVNLRKVRWTSFQPNFFIQFADGVLNDAPKTFIVTLGPMTDAKKLEVQLQIVKALPNISIIDVSQVVQRLTKIVDQMSLALIVMALFSMFVGLVILFSVVSYKIVERRKEFNLMKVLGSQYEFIKNILLLELFTIIALASIVGTLLSNSVAFILTYFIFDADFITNVSAVTVIVFATLFVTTLCGIIIVRQVMNARPLELLNS